MTTLTRVPSTRVPKRHTTEWLINLLTFFAQLDLRIAHDRVGSNTDPNLNGHFEYPNNLDQSLNDAAVDKIRKYRADYNNRTPSVVSLMPVITSTPDRLHSEFVRL